MDQTAALMSLATSVPPHQFQQKQILQAARSILAHRYEQFETFASLFANTGIRHRYGVKPIEWYLEPRGWPERASAFLDGAERLFIEVAQEAIARARLATHDIDTVVTVCSTGIATPTLEARLASKMGFRPDVARVPVFGLGCAGGVSGLAVAARLAQSRPGSNVLLVVLELCTLAVRHDELTKANIVAASLFGDGAAALACCAPATADRRGSRRPAKNYGPTRSASWAGTSTRKASAWSPAHHPRFRCRTFGSGSRRDSDAHGFE